MAFQTHCMSHNHRQGQRYSPSLCSSSTSRRRDLEYLGIQQTLYCHNSGKSEKSRRQYDRIPGMDHLAYLCPFSLQEQKGVTLTRCVKVAGTNPDNKQLQIKEKLILVIDEVFQIPQQNCHQRFAFWHKHGREALVQIVVAQ